MNERHLILASLYAVFPVLVAGQAPAPQPQLRPNQRAVVSPTTPEELARPAGADWLSYHGSYTGTHHSTLTQIDTGTVKTLSRAWVSDTDSPASGGRGGQGFPAAAPIAPGRTGVGGNGMGSGIIASAPIVRDGVLFYTSGAHAWAVDGRTGRQIWHYAGRSSGGISNRGLAIWQDTLFMMANGGLTALDATTGEERWVKLLDGAVPSTAPLVVRDHVYVASGSDAGTQRSFFESRNARTGEREWTFYSIPKEGEFGYNTWPGEEEASRGSGTPWQPPTYDSDQNLLIFGTGNPDPIKDNRARPGDNLFTDCTVALNADTGKMAWYFQTTPHDDHDFDNNQSMSLATVKVGGVDRKVVTWISRNGYFFTLDRTTGENIVTSKVFPSVNWAFDRLRSSGTPQTIENKSSSRGGTLVSPSSEGAANYPSQSFSPKPACFIRMLSTATAFFIGAVSRFWGRLRIPFVQQTRRQGK